MKIEGCEWKVPEEQITAWLGHFGTMESELEEDFFVDNTETEATNRTGNYSVLMKLETNMPQLIPMNGRRVKIYHKGITKLCTKCFGNHRKSDCKEDKKTDWIDYVANFMATHQEIPVELYGRWTSLVEKHQKNMIGKSSDMDNQTSNQSPTTSQPNVPLDEDMNQTESKKDDANETEKNQAEPASPPSETDFELPANEEEFESMVDRFASIGLKRSDLEKVLESRRTAYNKALREFKNAEKNGKLKTRKHQGNQERTL